MNFSSTACTGYNMNARAPSCSPSFPNIFEKDTTHSAVRYYHCHSSKLQASPNTLPAVAKLRNIFKALGVSRIKSSSPSILTTTERNIFVAHQQNLFSQYFHKILLLQHWPNISHSWFHVNKLLCKACVH